MKNTDGLLKCSKKCMELGVSCEASECRHWINYPQEFNCCLVSVYENGPMTLRQVAERIHLSFARIKQIETKALQKIKKRIGSFDSYF